jgi:hypothetical protein
MAIKTYKLAGRHKLFATNVWELELHMDLNSLKQPWVDIPSDRVEIAATI